MKPFLIFGTGDFADIVGYIIEHEMNAQVSGYMVNERFMDKDIKNGLPVVPFENVEEFFNPTSYNCTIAYEGHDMFVSRRSITEELVKKGYSFDTVISDSAVITNASMGYGNIIMQNVFIGPFTSIGNGNIFWGTAQLQHHNVIGDYNCFAPGTVTCGYTEILEHSFFGANSTIKNGIRISPRTFIGANVYIDRDTDADSVWLPPRAYQRRIE